MTNHVLSAPRQSCGRALRYLAVLAFIFLGPGEALAQDEASGPDVQPAELTEQSAGLSEAPGAALDVAVSVRLRVADAFASLPRAPGDIAHAIANARPDGSLVWLAWTALLAGISLTLATLARALVGRWGERVVGRLMWRGESERARRIAAGMARIGMRWLGDVSFFLTGIAAVLVLVPTAGPARRTTLVLLVAAFIFLVLRDLSKSLFAPHRNTERILTGLDDGTAQVMHRDFAIITMVVSALLALAIWVQNFGVETDVANLTRILTTAVAAGLFVVYLVRHRAPITHLVRGDAVVPRALRRFLGSTWLAIATVYIVAATLLRWGTIVLHEGGFAGPILAPIIAAIAGFFLYGLIVLVVDSRFEAHRRTLRAGSNLPEPEPRPLAEPIAPPAEQTVVEPVTAWRLRWMRLTDHLAAVGSTIFAVFAFVMMSSGLDISAATRTVLTLCAVLFLTYAVYATLKTYIDGKIDEEMPVGASGDAEEGMGPGASRLATLLPLLKNALYVVVLAFAATVLLASAGVNVAPLFAGAGVIGLAVGFGAQALIRDIFSGVFFLADDAFRRGEYVDVGGAMGAVEKISLRSFQLRHHNGPLHTIPFGEIKQLTNFSRDWVIMKLPLRIAYGTDVEKVRKLVKKLGQELASDPEVGPLFLQPLKSQGVVEMEDSAMIMRVKFMTKPGDQFVARRHVFTRIGELFEQEGIRFAHREVTVRIADHDNHDPAVEQQAASAGAARALQEAASR
ncbi:MAG: mechanosensitive ion channel family protein [Pseudomonadota bacterium]